MTIGTAMHAKWIAAELLTNIHENIKDLGLSGFLSCKSDDTFNICVDGKVVCSKGFGQPVRDYEDFGSILFANYCRGH